MQIKPLPCQSLGRLHRNFHFYTFSRRNRARELATSGNLQSTGDFKR